MERFEAKHKDLTNSENIEETNHGTGCSASDLENLTMKLPKESKKRLQATKQLE